MAKILERSERSSLAGVCVLTWRLLRYWWVLVGVAFLAITSGGGDK